MERTQPRAASREPFARITRITLSSDSIRLADVQRLVLVPPPANRRGENEILNDRPPVDDDRENTSSYKSRTTAQERRKSDEKGDWIHYECCRLKASIMCFSLSNDDGLPAAAAVGSLRAESPPGTLAAATRQQHPSPTLLVSGAKPQGNGAETSYGRETRYSNAPSTGLHQGERL
jgi:hypothetical protein